MRSDGGTVPGSSETLTERETHELILDVFVKSTLDVFSDPAQRKELGARIAGHGRQLAPVHLSLSHAIDKFCALATEKVTPVLIHTYNEHLLATDIYRIMRGWPLKESRPTSSVHGPTAAEPARGLRSCYR